MIIYSKGLISQGFQPLLVNQSLLPFEISVETLPAWDNLIDGYNYSHAGTVDIYIRTVSSYLFLCSGKVENILKGSLVLIPSPSPSVKIQITGGKVCLRSKAKHCWVMSTNFFLNRLLTMFSLCTSSKLSHQ